MQRQKDFEYVSSLFKNVSHITGTLIMIKAEYGLNSYTSAVGNPMKEETLIMGDASNNVIMCFQPHDNTCTQAKILEGVNIMPYFKYDNECVVHKKQTPKEIPGHLINLIIKTNVSVTNVTNNFSKVILENRGARLKTVKAFMLLHYNNTYIVSIKEVKRHPEWKSEYAENIMTKLINVCKSCKKRAYKGCCPSYSSQNRSKIKVVVGFNE